MDQAHADKREYELSFLLKTKDAETALEALLAQYEAEVFFKGPVVETRLAYPIKKQSQALFGYLHFRALPDSVDTLLQSLKLNSSVLRVLLVTPPISRGERAVRIPEERKEKVIAAETVPVAPKTGMLTNEALEEKLEEILK
jgi:ribosomal protein S6